jgi:succinoglycan biosynthesis transport protein ExoP
MELQDYLQIFSKWKWVIICSIFFVFIGAIIYILVTPKQYKSTTTILVIPQRVPENYVRSTVAEGMEGRLATIQQQLTSRTRLTKVMDELGLFKKEREEMAPERVIEMMKKKIEIDVAKDPTRDRPSESRNQAFSISFVDTDPKLAMLTTDRLASLFIEENLKSREKIAAGTSEFLESQLRQAKARLEAQEQKINQYKLQFLGELPQQLGTNLTKLNILQDQYRSNADRLRAAETKKLNLQAMIQTDKRQTLMTELASRRNQLAELSAKYTDSYPDVIRLRKEVEQLERKIAEKRGIELEGIGRMEAEIASVDAEMASLTRERANIQRNIDVLQAKADQSPLHEQEMITLTHNYDNLKKEYDDLLQKREEAKISEKMEISTHGDQFQILDPANLPEVPFKPKPKLIFGFAFLMAGFLGFGGAIGLEKMDLTLRGVTDFKHYFDLPILASIPILETVEFVRRKNLRRKAIIGGMISFAFALFALLLFFAIKFN